MSRNTLSSFRQHTLGALLRKYRHTNLLLTFVMTLNLHNNKPTYYWLILSASDHYMPLFRSMPHCTTRVSTACFTFEEMLGAIGCLPLIRSQRRTRCPSRRCISDWKLPRRRWMLRKMTHRFGRPFNPSPPDLPSLKASV